MTDMDSIRIHGAHYKPPDCLPAGIWETLTPLAQWISGQLLDTYDAGYWAGRLDATRERVDRHDRRPPPPAAEVAATL